MSDAVAQQESLEAVLKDEIFRMYEAIATDPDSEFHFFHGREAAELFGYDTATLDSLPRGAVQSFAGVGNPHIRARITPGETVLDLGSGAGLDASIAARAAGPQGRVIGVDMNPAMIDEASTNVAGQGAPFEAHLAPIEALPVEDGSVDVAISNGVINLSFRKRKVFEEIFRVLKPGGRMSITDIVSGKQLSQNIVNDPKLWAS